MNKVREDNSADSPVRWPEDVKGLSEGDRQRLEGLVILGTLLREVAHADGDFSEAEQKSVKAILSSKGGLKPEETALVFAAASESATARMDIQGFTREINKTPYQERLNVVELLFKVAFADSGLSMVEHEKIRDISKLLWVSHKDFIATKLKVRDAQ